FLLSQVASWSKSVPLTGSTAARVKHSMSARDVRSTTSAFAAHRVDQLAQVEGIGSSRVIPSALARTAASAYRSTS
ncbi:MAG: hypothetical protein M3256_05555, partial [Actinomycetota bacterium]|nr:hypothetical protein [Actinomycetota bacterium]